MGLVLFAGEGKALSFKGGTGHIQTVFLRGTQGHPAVEAALQPGVRYLQQREGHSELARHRLLLGDAQGFSVAVSMGQQVVQLRQSLLAGAVRQGQGAQPGPTKPVMALLPPSGQAA